MKTKFLLSAMATLILAFGFTTVNAASIKHEGSKAPISAVSIHKHDHQGPQKGKKHHHRHLHHKKHHHMMKDHK